MAGVSLHGAAIIFGVVGLVLLVGAAVSPVWMKICLPFDKIINMAGKAAGQPDGGMPDGVPDFTSMLAGKHMCLRQGLFGVSLDAGGLMNMAMPMKLSSMPRYVYFTALGFGLGMIFTIVAVVLLIMAARGTRDSYEMKAKVARRTRIAIIMIGFAALLTLCGMSVYTGKTAEFVENPEIFALQFGKAVMGSLPGIGGDMGQGAGTGFDANFPGRRRRDLTTDGMADMGQELLKELKPAFGYSFILGWVSVVMLMISLVLSVVAKQYLLHHPYSSGNMPL